jgi:catechol 2,3-dioxygenase-like lactoylglutathione lyase family enzyme
VADDTIAFTGLNLVCADLEATLAFYRLLGVPIPDEQVWREHGVGHHVNGVLAGSTCGLDFDSVALANAYHQGHREAPSPGGAIFGFSVPSREAVDEVHRRMTEAGHPSRQPPVDAFWGARYAIVADPDGRDVGLMSPIDPDRRSQGPSF